MNQKKEKLVIIIKLIIPIVFQTTFLSGIQLKGSEIKSIRVTSQYI